MINFADIIVIAIFVIFIIIGFARGFMRSLTKLMGSFVSFLIAMFLCSYVCALVCMSQVDEWMISSFANIFEGLGGSINALVGVENTDIVVSSLVSIGIPDFVAKLFAPSLIALIPDGTVQPVSMLLAGFTAQLILVVVVTILLFIVIRVLVQLINLFIRLLLKDKLLKFVDRLLGVIFHGVLATIFIMTALTCANYFIDQPYAAVVKEQITMGSVSKIFYENNVIKSLCDTYLDFDRIFKEIINWISGGTAEGIGRQGSALYPPISIGFIDDSTRQIVQYQIAYCGNGLSPPIFIN